MVKTVLAKIVLVKMINLTSILKATIKMLRIVATWVINLVLGLLSLGYIRCEYNY